MTISRRQFARRLLGGTAALSLGGVAPSLSGCGGGGDGGEQFSLGDGCAGAGRNASGAAGGRAANRYRLDVLYSIVPVLYWVSVAGGTTGQFLNDYGQVAGTDFDHRGLSDHRALYWSEGRLTVLDQIQPFTGALIRGINNAGAIIGLGRHPQVSGFTAFALHTDGRVVPLEQPEIAQKPRPHSEGVGGFEVPGTPEVVPNSINDCGIVVGRAGLRDELGVAVLWNSSDGRLLARIAPEYHPLSECRINERNQVAFVAHSRSPSDADKVILWQNGEARELGTPFDPSPPIHWWKGGPAGLNNNGNIVLSGGANGELFMWRSDAGRFVNLGRPAFALRNFTATAINDSDVIVGTADWDPFRHPESAEENDTELGRRSSSAALWQDGEFIDLNERIDPALNVELFYGWDINNAGQVLAYGGHYVENRRADYLILLTPEA